MTNNSKIKVSIIIPHLKGEKNLFECIQSIKSKVKFEIIIVDNNSAGESINNTKAKFSQVQIIKSNYNRGYAGGCNLGAKHAQGEYLFFLNDDTIMQKNTLEKLIKIMDDNENVSSVQPKILNYYNKNKFDYAGACGGFIDYLGYPYARGRIFDTIEIDSHQYDDVTKIFWASGTAFMTRSKIFEKIGMFDKILFAHMEEIDYHWKCSMNDFDVLVEPKAIIYHKGGQTLPYGSFKKIYLNHRNSLILFLSNNNTLSFSNFIKRFFLEIVALIYYTIKFNFKGSFAVFRSLLYILFNIRYIKNRRKKNLHDIKRVENQLILKSSIIYQYYLKGKKIYQEID
tara:strand:+ start:1292 stop:2314 length:1023 start_codon:yes stop_codon:yes gene_type:complete